MTSTRHLWIIWTGFLIFVMFAVWFGESFGKAFTGPLDSFHWGIAGMSLWCALGCYYLINRLLRKASQHVNDGHVGAAMKSWTTSRILSFAMSEAIVLYGLVVAMIGSPLWFSRTLYSAGLLLLILYRPVRPSFFPAHV